MYLREANEDDRDLYFEWANDSEVRANSFNNEPIIYANHCEWFAKMLAAEDVFLYVLMIDDQPVGQVRLSVSGDVAEISYSIDKEFRGKGFGKRIIGLIKEKATELPQVRKLIGKIKTDNKKSSRCFLSNGFSEEFTQYSIDL